MKKLTITVEDAAKALGVNRNTAYTAIREGQIPTIRIGRRILISKVAFDRWLEEAGQKPVAKAV